ncbi:putative Palmitoyl-protein thioesterase, partial [Operophtera brumata]
MLLLTFALSLAISPCLAFRPVVLVHGIMTGSGSMEMIQHRIQEVLEIGMDVANISAQHPEGINLLGYSQGGLIARGIVQTFPNTPCGSYSTLASASTPRSEKSEDFKKNFLRLKRLVLIGGPDDD